MKMGNEPLMDDSQADHWVTPILIYENEEEPVSNDTKETDTTCPLTIVAGTDVDGSASSKLTQMLSSMPLYDPLNDI
jgi:hypothetical protein